MTNDYNESPETIKTDIERTRQDMSSKIEQIQARLNPDNLKMQAQETVRDIMRESTESLTSYFSEHSKELGASVAHVIKHNPIPAALIGLGVGWLLVESFTSSSDNSPNYSRQWREQQRGEWYPAESQYSGYTSGSRYATGGMSSGQYQGAGSYQPSASQYQYGSSSYQSGQSSTGGYSSYTSSEQPGWMKDKADQIGEKVGEKAEQWRESAQQVGEQVREGAQEVRERVDQWGNQISSQASAIGEQATHYTQQAREQAAHVGEQISHVGEHAQAYVQQTGYQLQRRLEDNPLIFGGVALAIGALVGLALPETRRENEMMGQWRDEVVHSAQEVAQDAVERVQHVAEELKPKLEESANKVVSDLKQTGKVAMEDVKQTGREALEQTKQTAKEAVGDAKQALSESADKVKTEAEKTAEKAKSEFSTTRQA